MWLPINIAVQFASRQSSDPELNVAISEVTAGLADEYEFGCFFVSNRYNNAARACELLNSKINVKHLVGCTTMGTIGADGENQNGPAISLLVGQMPGAKIEGFHMTQTELATLHTNDDWYGYLDIYPCDKPAFLVLPDPFGFDLETMLTGLNMAFMGQPVLGGIASGAARPKQNSLFLQNTVYSEGAVLLVLRNTGVEWVVSQGCQPFGERYFITDSEKNVIKKLAGRAPLDILEENLQNAGSEIQRLVNQGLFVGLAPTDEAADKGQYLIRGLVKVDEESGSLAIAGPVHSGQIIQFHIRDYRSAAEELKKLLAARENPGAALVFNCNGRGTHMYREPDHDLKLIQSQYGQIPLACFFCAGEIGPIHRENFIHTFTNSILLLGSNQSQ